MSRGRPTAILIFVVLVTVTVALYLVFRLDDDRGAYTGADAPPWALLGDSEGFVRPRSPHEFSFPADYGPHPAYRTEWWNVAGSLEDGQGNRLGVQLTMLRFGLLADPPDRASRWAATDVYAAVFSVSDPVGGRLRTDVRVSRAAIGLAGASAEPRRVWVDDWKLEQMDGAAPALALTAQSRTGEVVLTLTLLNEKPLIDENEVIDTGQGSPFHFYLQPRLGAEGRLRMDETELAVHGTMSMEHAWGELPLPGGPVAVDRFTLHLRDGRELLLSRIHRVDGSGNPDTTGLLIGTDGRPLVLDSGDVRLGPSDYWKNDDTGARYPVRWSLHIPDHALELVLSPYHEDQAGVAWLPFWAGPMRISTQSATVGNGLVQLTGY